MSTESTNQDDHIAELVQAPAAQRWMGYLKMSGPGFMQSACTIGGGTLGGCLFLGSVLGAAGLWVQPVAIVFGVIILAMIAHVALNHKEDPLRLINHSVSPVLGYGWLLATVAANMIWGLPQYNLGVGAVTQNIMPDLDGSMGGKAAVTAFIAIAATAIIWTRGSGGKGVKIFETAIKLVIALIVVCFGAVVVSLIANGQIDYGAVVAGFIPDLSLMWAPAAVYQPMLESVGATADYWHEHIIGVQRDRIFAVVGAAVGINMTFLMPYALRERKWGSQHGGLARFDLVIGMMIPFVLVTSFVIMATAFTLHNKGDERLEALSFVEAPEEMDTKFGKSLTAALAARDGGDAVAAYSEEERAAALDTLTATDRKLALATLGHGAQALATPINSLFGGKLGNIIFGVGVFAIALSTAVILMTINGYALQAAFGIPQRIGALLPLVAIAGPFVWGDIGFYLAVPTSVIGLMLMPLALWSFFLVATSKKVMGEKRLGPGVSLVIFVPVMVYTILSIMASYGKIGWYGPGLVAVIAVLAVLTSPLVLKRAGGAD